MKATKSIETLYNVLLSHFGPIEAKNTVSDILYNLIDDLQESGLPVTEAAIEEKLAEKANDYLVASKNRVA